MLFSYLTPKFLPVITYMNYVWYCSKLYRYLYQQSRITPVVIVTSCQSNDKLYKTCNGDCIIVAEATYAPCQKFVDLSHCKNPMISYINSVAGFVSTQQRLFMHPATMVQSLLQFLYNFPLDFYNVTILHPPGRFHKQPRPRWCKICHIVKIQ